ncbi:MAG: ABC transporter permease, partial [Bacteroidales bacterium]
MIIHYFKTALRFLLRNPWITFINVTGLAIGLAVFILIILFVQNELRYDKFNENLDSVCRWEVIQGDYEGAWTTSALGPDAMEAIPEIISFVRFKHWSDVYLDYGERKYNIPNIAWADSNVFDLFTLEMVKGNPETALVRPLTAVITENMAKIIFGDEDPVGKVLRFSDGTELEITGLIRDPENFHIQLDIIGSFVTLGYFYGQEHLYTYRTYQYMTYFKLAPQVTPEIADSKADEFYHRKLVELEGEERETSFRVRLRPLRDVYFARNTRDYGTKHGNFQFVVIFTIIAFTIIIIACINFINISTA